jgi:hypothetical protein
MSFLFRPYRSTQSTQEVLARLRLKLVLNDQPLVFFWPRDQTSAKRAKSFPFLCSISIIAPSVPCCPSLHSLSGFSGLIALSLVVVSR